MADRKMHTGTKKCQALPRYAVEWAIEGTAVIRMLTYKFIQPLTIKYLRKKESLTYPKSHTSGSIPTKMQSF